MSRSPLHPPHRQRGPALGGCSRRCASQAAAGSRWASDARVVSLTEGNAMERKRCSVAKAHVALPSRQNSGGAVMSALGWGGRGVVQLCQPVGLQTLPVQAGRLWHFGVIRQAAVAAWRGLQLQTAVQVQHPPVNGRAGSGAVHAATGACWLQALGPPAVHSGPCRGWHRQ